MCFSPTASFCASAVLAATGVVAITYSKSAAQRMLACVPVLFAIQQFSEGVLWLSLLHQQWAYLKPWSMYLFLIFAQVVWPAYIPFSMLLFEANKRRRNVITILTIAGVLLSVYTMFCLFHYPVDAQADHNHIRYNLGFELSKQWYYALLYFLPTIVAPLISGVKILRWLGYLFLASYVISRLLFHLYVVSVWCFFGAAISLVILLTVFRLNKNAARPGGQTKLF